MKLDKLTRLKMIDDLYNKWKISKWEYQAQVYFITGQDD